MAYLSTVAIAAKLGCDPATVSRAAVRLGLGIRSATGRLIGIDEADVEAIRKIIRPGTPGNPNFGKAAKKAAKRTRRRKG
jgi:hypothetical protein